MRILVLTFFVVISILSGKICYAEYATIAFDKANVAYKANNFTEAAKLYEQLINTRGKSSELYYNLANCYFKMDLLGKSIVNYERALLLAPDDEDILHNLKLARSKTIDRVQSVPQLGIVTQWKNFISSQSASSWGAIALILLWLSLLLAAVYLFVANHKLVSASGWILLGASLLLLMIGFSRNKSETESGVGVLTTSSENAKSAPDENAQNIFVIHEGIRFMLVDQVGKYHKIRLEDGQVGWVLKESVEQV